MHEPAAIAAQIQHQPLHALGFEGLVCIPDCLAHAFREFVHEDVTVGPVKHADVFDGREDDAFAHDGDFNHLAGFPGGAAAEFLDGEDDFGAGFPAHALRAFLTGEPVGGGAVDGEDLVAAAEACPCGR